MSVTQPLKWHGGKRYLARRIVDMIPPHTRYLEACGGGLSVLLHKPSEGFSEFVNDTNKELTNFWETIRDPVKFELFKRMCEATPLSEIEFAITKVRTPEVDDYNPVEKAWRFFIECRQSRQGLRKDYCTPTARTRRGMNEQVSAWLSAVDGLPEVHERLKRVEIWNRPAVKAIEKLDNEDFFTYVDPPYVHSTRNTIGEYGEHEMENSDHMELLECLSNMKGKFALSGYANPLYDVYANTRGWTVTTFELPNNASSSKTKERKIECVWTNYQPTFQGPYGERS